MQSWFPFDDETASTLFFSSRDFTGSLVSVGQPKDIYYLGDGRTIKSNHIDETLSVVSKSKVRMCQARMIDLSSAHGLSDKKLIGNIDGIDCYLIPFKTVRCNQEATHDFHECPSDSSVLKVETYPQGKSKFYCRTHHELKRKFCHSVDEAQRSLLGGVQGVLPAQDIYKLDDLITLRLLEQYLFSFENTKAENRTRTSVNVLSIKKMSAAQNLVDTVDKFTAKGLDTPVGFVAVTNHG